MTIDRNAEARAEAAERARDAAEDAAMVAEYESRPKYTPGPWAVYADTVGPEDVGKELYRFFIGDEQLPPTEANALLAAAAPELVEALRELVLDCEHRCKMRGVSLRNAQALIAKIDGGDA